MSPDSRLPAFPDFTPVRRDRVGGGGGGLVTLIHHSIPFLHVASPINDGIVESLVVNVNLAGNNFNIANVYIPPASSTNLPPNYQASLAPLFALSNTIVLGDVNGHNEEWSRGVADIRGDRIATEVDASNYSVLNNPDISTRPCSDTSPDVALVPTPWALSFDWITSTALNSDHLPVSLLIADESPPSRVGREYTNFKKAEWEEFKNESESLFADLPLPTSCAEGEKVWRRVLQSCSAHHIPAGFHRNFVPGLDAVSASLIAERDARRSRDPNDPELPGLNLRISASLASESRKRWMETVTDCDRRSNPSHFWRLLKGLSGKRTTSTPNQPIKFKDKMYSKTSTIADKFCSQYANVKSFVQDKEARKIYRNVKVLNQLDVNYSPFSEPDTIDAIKASKNSTAAGPNGLTILHLKHLGPNGIRFLTRLFNISVQSAEIPSIWKCANVVPVPKPNKPLDQGTSYRPISLLCPEVKVLERLNLPIMRASLQPSPSQHGFRSNHSTTTALLPLTNQIARGFNSKKPAKRTGLVCVDLSKAFDVVDHHRLLWKIHNSNLNPNLKRWLVSYLRDRKVRCLYQGKASRWRKVKMGVPQGSVLSPLLWNYFINDISTDAEVDESYADDLHGATSDVKPSNIAVSLSSAAQQLSDQAKEHGLSLSGPKSTVTLFTPWNKEYGRLPPVSVDGDVIPQDNHPKLLGVTYDPTLCFNSHALAMARKASSRVNILRAVSASSFGNDTECLTATFKGIVQPFFDYCAPVVSPFYSDASRKRLQLVQNRALRHVTGAHLASAIDHLHAEVGVLPVKDHLRLLSAQFLARAMQPIHPSHATVVAPDGLRCRKPTLLASVGDLVAPHLVDGVIPPGAYPEVIKSIHTQVVREAIDKSQPNRVLGFRPPRISPTEACLPRLSRTTLSQLRSGHCARLNDYLYRIDRSDSDNCPDCLTLPASVQHLFECPANPTNLTTLDLWENPCETINFLSETSSFSHLEKAPPPHLRRRRPPPEPPPPLSPPPPVSPVSSLFSPFSFPSDLSLSSFSLTLSPPLTPLGAPLSPLGAAGSPHPL